MPRRPSRRWLHPQTVPRGFLRLYILTLLSRSPESGYSVMQRIEEVTEGAWRPGPGTMYPLLRDLVEDHLAREAGKGRGRGRRVYELTEKGRRDLEEMRQMMASLGGKERVMARLFADVLPAESFARMVVNRFREGSDVFRHKVLEMQQEEREALMREFSPLLENQLLWVDSHLGSPPQRPKAGTPS